MIWLIIAAAYGIAVIDGGIQVCRWLQGVDRDGRESFLKYVKSKKHETR
jgi:hypothetical protein